MKYRILILLSLLLIAVAYSIISLMMAKNPDQPENRFQSVFGFSNNKNSIDQTSDNNDILYPKSKLSKNQQIKNLIFSTQELPYDFTVTGISEIVRNHKQVPLNEIRVLIKFENELYEHLLNDFLLNTDMQLVNIEAKQITVLFDDMLYKKALTLPNLLSSDFRKPEKTHAEFMQMSAAKIGTRPRIIEHFVNLTTTPYIADGKLVSPGLNPILFKQAGFKEDDVLKQINGKSVTIESEFEDIKKELKTAQTLKLLVMRKGRMMTLYLDIPSEGLDLVRD